MPTKQELEADLKHAMRSGDDLRKRTLRMLLSNIKLAEVEARRPLDESEVLGAIQKEVKTRNESIEEARQYKREDLAQAAQDEIDVLQASCSSSHRT
ncbi:MAG: GatB/YqeY domain-containing protein [Anaerolineales bacterium]